MSMNTDNNPVPPQPPVEPPAAPKPPPPETPPPKPPKRGDEPPDLETVWRELTQKINQLLGLGGKKPGSAPKKNSRPSSSTRGNSAALSPPKVHHSKQGGTVQTSQNPANPAAPHPSETVPKPVLSTAFTHTVSQLNFKPRLNKRTLSVLVLAWLSSGTFIVPEGHIGIVTQWGEYVARYAPGLAWRLPYPIQSEHVVDLEGLRTLNIGTLKPAANLSANERAKETFLTADESMVQVQFEVQYHLKKHSDLAYVFGNLASNNLPLNRRADPLISALAESAMREEIGKHALDTVLNPNRTTLNQAVHTRLQQWLDRYQTPVNAGTIGNTRDQKNFDTGIQISRVSIQAVQPPESLRTDFDTVTQAAQEQSRLINDSTAYANDTVLRAKATANRLLLEAQGYKHSVTQAAAGEAARFKVVQEEYAKAPAVTRQRLYLDTMQQVFESTSTVLTDSKNSTTIHMPLDKLLTPNSTAPASAAATATPTAPAPETAATSNATTLSNMPKEPLKTLSQPPAQEVAQPVAIAKDAAQLNRERDAKDFR
jgi:modulator of FtsH protease HflK